jgi:hypothetical protein
MFNISSRVLYIGRIYSFQQETNDRICGLVVRVPDYRSRGSGSIPGATRLSEK